MHFSQFTRISNYLNPALTGVYDGDWRLSSNYRNQWKTVPVPYKTMLFSLETKLFNQKIKTGTLASALYFGKDKAGDGDLGWTQIGLSTAYAIPLKNNLFISVGLQGSLGQRSIGFDKLTFDNQYNGTQFDPTQGSGENADRSQFFYGDISGGINFHYQKDTRTKLDIGGSLAHITSPKNGFYKNNTLRTTPQRLSYYLNASFKVGSKIDLMPAVLYQEAGTLDNLSQELVSQLQFKYYLNQARFRTIALSIGGGYRHTFKNPDAIITYFGIDYQDLAAHISYDINISDFSLATEHRGGIELALEYIFTKPQKKATPKIYIPYPLQSLKVNLPVLTKIPELPTLQNEDTIFVVQKTKNEPALPKEIKLKQFPSIEVYFDNDHPNENSYDTITTYSYSSLVEKYYNKKGVFKSKNVTDNQGEIDAFFENEILGGAQKLEKLAESILKLLKEGKQVEIELKGYCSPRSFSKYNLNLSKRRIESVKLFVEKYKNQVFVKYILNGQLKFYSLPFGENNASSTINDKINMPSHSIFSLAASLERKVKIVTRVY